jgi:hypothetical protein
MPPLRQGLSSGLYNEREEYRLQPVFLLWRKPTRLGVLNTSEAETRQKTSLTIVVLQSRSLSKAEMTNADKPQGVYQQNPEAVD